MNRVALVVPVVLIAGGVTSAHAVTLPSHAAAKCKGQTVTWSKGAKNTLTLSKGPKVRSKITGGVQITDNVVVAQWTLSTDGGTPTHFLNVTTNDQVNAPLASAAIYPTKGKKKTFRIKAGAKHDFAYKNDLLYDVGQVLGPTSGDTGQGRPTPKLKKVVVKLKECPTSTG